MGSQRKHGGSQLKHETHSSSNNMKHVVNS